LRRSRLTRGWAVGSAVVVLCVAFFGYLASMLQQLPAPGHDDVLARSIVVYDRNGKLLAERNAEGQFHVVRKLSEMGRLGPAATLAAEDRGFYQHGAVDPLAMARAAATDVLEGGYYEGGSTISQQLVKIQLQTPRKTVDRKLQEALLAWALEHRYSKDQILEMYLNRVYYGHGAYGLASAAKTYFGNSKEPADLTAAQAAFLAGLIQAPSGYDPAVHYDLARQRELYALHGMVQVGVLSDAQEQQAEQEPIDRELKFDVAYRQEEAPHLVDYVTAQLEKQFGAAAVQAGGFAVTTTIDPALQALAQRAVVDGVRSLSRLGVNNGDLLAVRPETGEVLAWVGSADYSDATIGGQYDVITSPRQPGSSFKPYVYEAALRDHRITLCTTLHDQPTNFGGYRPLDFDNSYMGSLTARRALVLSRNIPAVEVASKEGIGNVIELARAMGVTSHLDPTLPTAIGASDVTMFEHVQGYQVFANGGLKVPITAVTRITDRSGTVVYQTQPGSQAETSRVLTPAETYLMADVLKDYARQWGLGWSRQMAGKSGTSGGTQVGVHPDAWMMGYNPDIVVGAWAGNTGPNGAGKPVSAFGVNVGETISAEFINGLPQSFSHWYARPDGLTQTHGGELLLAGTESLAPTCTGGGGSPGQDKKNNNQPAPPDNTQGD
jgi:membrane peptidoglycan carboxypeptidase